MWVSRRGTRTSRSPEQPQCEVSYTVSASRGPFPRHGGDARRVEDAEDPQQLAGQEKVVAGVLTIALTELPADGLGDREAGLPLEPAQEEWQDAVSLGADHHAVPVELARG